MKLMNVNEDVPEVFYIFIGQGKTLSSKINFYNYNLTHRIISSGFQGIMVAPEQIQNFIEGDINYIPYLPTETTLTVPSSHRLAVVNGYTTEYALERYRYNNFKTFPSRFSCIYAFGDFESCKLASEYYNWDLSKVKRFKLKYGINLSNAIKICKCNMEIVTYMWNHDLQHFSIEQSDEFCKAYWNGEGAVGSSRQDINTGHYITTNSGVLYEYLIEGVLEEIIEY